MIVGVILRFIWVGGLGLGVWGLTKWASRFGGQKNRESQPLNLALAAVTRHDSLPDEIQTRNCQDGQPLSLKV